MSQRSIIAVCILILISLCLPPTAYAANLLQVSDTLTNPKTSTITKHTLSFTTDSAVADGFFRFLISDSFALGSPVTITGADVSDYTFVSGVATPSGDTNCTSPSGFHCLEIHYSGSGAVSAPINITVTGNTLTNPNLEGVYPFQLRHFDSVGTLISQTQGMISIHDNSILTAKVLPIEISLPPQLLFPDTNAVTNNPYEPFGFKRAYSITGISHYDLHLDGSEVAGNIVHSAISQDSYFFSTGRVGETIQVNLKFPISDGLHYWQVRAISLALGSLTASSETRYFTVDTTIPLITLTNVGNNSISWASYDPSTIPDPPRELVVTSKDPLLQGKVEAYSNLKIALICPNGHPECTNQSVIVNETDGNWEHLFHNLIKDVKYTGYLAAVDAAGNTNIFPEFFVTYVPKTLPFFPTPTRSTAVLSPDSQSGSPSASPSPITPPEIIKRPPPSPTVHPSPFVAKGEVGQAPLDYRFLILFTLVGLLLHLLLTNFGAGIPLLQIPSFFWRLLFPFLLSKDYQTINSKPLPFVTISLFNADDIKGRSFQTVSQIQGHFSLPKDLPKNLFVKVTRPGFIFQDRILDHRTFKSIKKIKLEAKDSLSALERLQISSLTIRWLPLTIANLTGITASLLTQNIFTIAYTVIALELTYSEYIYPRKASKI